MKSLMTIAAVAGLIASASAPANAFPLLTGAVTVENPNVVDVGWRCGPHRHWSWRLHRCVRNGHHMNY